ncbi:MAG: acyl-CoA dehydrogenase [Caldilineae bacterium]|nr:MAG: acyl-CoA dehydrogenase [Caldilineae bacterium]
MISFSLTEEQQMLVDAVKRYAERALRKSLREADESGQLPAELLATGWELGLIPSSIPEEYGGFGEHAALTGVLFAEELAWGDLSAALALLAPNLLVVPVLEYGTDEQKRNLLPQFCDMTYVPATAALIEPSFTFDPYNLETTAVRQNGHYILNGRKAYVPMAAEAGQLLVYAREEGQTQAFIVNAGTPGLLIGEREKNMGLKALPTYRVTLEDCQIGADCKLGGEAGIQFTHLQNYSHVAMAAMAVGVARASYEYALAYAKEREAFGEPIASRQAIAFMLAEMAIEIDATRLMVWEAAWKLDRGEDATREANLVKRYADDMVLKVTDGGVQVLGGHGYIREHPVELWLRNGRGFGTLTGLAMV